MNFVKALLIVLVILFLWPRQVQAYDNKGHQWRAGQILQTQQN